MSDPFVRSLRPKATLQFDLSRGGRQSSTVGGSRFMAVPLFIDLYGAVGASGGIESKWLALLARSSHLVS